MGQRLALGIAFTQSAGEPEFLPGKSSKSPNTCVGMGIDLFVAAFTGDAVTAVFASRATPEVRSKTSVPLLATQAGVAPDTTIDVPRLLIVVSIHLIDEILRHLCRSIDLARLATRVQF
jgi:hypothetical protein